MKLMMLRGLPASGKSTWAKEFILSQPTGAWKRVNKDDLRAMIDAGKWSHGNEQFIIQVRDTLVEIALKKGINVIVDDTNLSHVHSASLLSTAMQCGAEFEIKDFEVTLDEAIKRDLARPNSVGASVIKRMYYESVLKKPGLNPDGIPAIMCDLDGTLAKIGKRNPYDASTCGQDEINAHVYHMIETYKSDHDIIFMSGRSEEYRPQTEAWLEKRILFPHGYKLFMRPIGDNRKDAIVKLELFEKFVNPYYTVNLVLDDRDQVVEMWRAIGLECWQVANGDF